MAYLTLPISSSYYDQTFTAELEGVVYNFRFKYNSRAGRWTMDISSEDGTPIVNGIPIVSSFELIRRFAKSELPPGRIVAVDLFESGEEPGEFSFDSGFELVYAETGT
jgi:hypothetical protein